MQNPVLKLEKKWKCQDKQLTVCGALAGEVCMWRDGGGFWIISLNLAMQLFFLN